MARRLAELTLAGGRIGAVLTAALTLGAVGPGQVGLKDITADAVTRATIRNIHTGDVARLTDGHTPEDDPSAGALGWEGVGMVAVSWPDSVRLAQIRVYVTGVSRYRVFGYLGGGFSARGDREGPETAIYGRQDVVPADSSGWWDISFAADAAIDNLSFQVVDGGAIYEMRFLAVSDTHQGMFGCRGLTTASGVADHIAPGD